jgi:formate dehydrogenase maturation protein FdhE
MRSDELRKRASRALALAERYPEAREALRFYAEVASLQSRIDPKAPLSSLPDLRLLAQSRAPEPLRSEAVDEAACRRAMDAALRGEELDSPRSFFARVLLQASTTPSSCSAHRTLPQAGSLKPEAQGTALALVCAICLGEWSHPRGTCFGCGASGEDTVAYYEAPELPSLRVATCERCRRYVHVVRLDVDPDAIPDVDEIAALSLDVWARERGYEKLVPNLVGI